MIVKSSDATKYIEQGRDHLDVVPGRQRWSIAFSVCYTSPSGCMKMRPAGSWHNRYPNAGYASVACGSDKGARPFRCFAAIPIRRLIHAPTVCPYYGADMSKTKEELLEEYKKKENEQEQLRHGMQRTENRKEYVQSVSRRNRTHRLITRGATIESIVPEVREMGERAFYLALEKFFDDESHRKSLCDEMSRQGMHL